jgi:hypothetical protein
MDEPDEEKSRGLSTQLGFPVVFRNGWILRPSRGGPPITSEMVRQWLEEADLEDASFNPDGTRRL